MPDFGSLCGERIIRNRLQRAAIAALTTLLLLLVASPAHAATLTIGADGWARFTLSPAAGATEIWIEVEHPDIDAADVRVSRGSVSATVTDTAFGAIAILPAAGVGDFGVALTTAADPDIAITVIDATGTILSSESHRVALVDYRTLSQAGSASAMPRELQVAGIAGALLLSLGLVAAILIVLGSTLKARAKATS